MMNILANNSMYMLEKSMGFLWTKQAAIADNIANAETPNYKPKVVTFEENLATHLAAATRSEIPQRRVRKILEESQFGMVETEETTRMDENGVNTTEQMVELARNAYQLQYVMQSINSDLAVLRSAVRGQ